MNILLDKLPKEIYVLDQYIHINTDYRTSIRFQNIIEDTTKTEQNKVLEALNLYLSKHDIEMIKTDTQLEHILNGILWFFSLGKTNNKNKSVKSNNNAVKAFDFEQDAFFIYSAFIQTYGIDLQNDLLHWWKFYTLFENLPEDTKIKQIIQYRTADTSKMDKNTKEFYIQQRKICALDRKRKEPIKKEDISKILSNSGDLTKITT